MPAAMGFTGGYTLRDVSKLLDLTPAEIRGFVRLGFLAPAQGPRGEPRFSLPDLVLLRTAKDLGGKLPRRRLKSALAKLRVQLPPGRPLSAVRITVEGDNLVVHDGPAVWEPESGQSHFDFDVASLASKVAPLARKAAEEAAEADEELAADDWYSLGCDLEVGAPDEARDAYRRALEADPAHVGAHVNLGRLLHEAGETDAAEKHYRTALASDPRSATAAYNLGVALEDRKMDGDAARAYEQALAADPRFADAHYNLARVYERMGDKISAFRHLKAYKHMTEGRSG